MNEFVLNDVRYEARDSVGCSGCAFRGNADCGAAPACDSGSRDDGRSVIWVKAAPSEQPAQGELPLLPIEWRKVEDDDGIRVRVFRAFQMWDYASVALAQRPALVALTREQVKAIWLEHHGLNDPGHVLLKFARAIEAEFCRVNGLTAPKAQEGE